MILNICRFDSIFNQIISEVETEFNDDLSEIDWASVTSEDLFGAFDEDYFPILWLLRIVSIIDQACYGENSDFECPNRNGSRSFIWKVKRDALR